MQSKENINLNEYQSVDNCNKLDDDHHCSFIEDNLLLGKEKTTNKEITVKIKQDYSFFEKLLQKDFGRFFLTLATADALIISISYSIATLWFNNQTIYPPSFNLMKKILTITSVALAIGFIFFLSVTADVEKLKSSKNQRKLRDLKLIIISLILFLILLIVLLVLICIHFQRANYIYQNELQNEFVINKESFGLKRNISEWLINLQNQLNCCGFNGSFDYQNEFQTKLQFCCFTQNQSNCSLSSNIPDCLDPLNKTLKKHKFSFMAIVVMAIVSQGIFLTFMIIFTLTKTRRNKQNVNHQQFNST